MSPPFNAPLLSWPLTLFLPLTMVATALHQACKKAQLGKSDIIGLVYKHHSQLSHSFCWLQELNQKKVSVVAFSFIDYQVLIPCKEKLSLQYEEQQELDFVLSTAVDYSGRWNSNQDFHDYDWV